MEMVGIHFCDRLQQCLEFPLLKTIPTLPFLTCMWDQLEELHLAKILTHLCFLCYGLAPSPKRIEKVLTYGFVQGNPSDAA